MLIFSCNNENTVKDFSTHDNYTVETTTNASITHTINGKLKAKIDVGKMERFNKNQIIYLSDGVKLNFYNNNIVTSTLTSEKAEIDEENNLLKALVNVTLTDKVEKTNKIGNPEENPKNNNFKTLLSKKTEILFLLNLISPKRR